MTGSDRPPFEIYPPRRRLPRVGVPMVLFVAGCLAFIAVMGALGLVLGSHAS